MADRNGSRTPAYAAIQALTRFNEDNYCDSCEGQMEHLSPDLFQAKDIGGGIIRYHLTRKGLALRKTLDGLEQLSRQDGVLERRLNLFRIEERRPA